MSVPRVNYLKNITRTGYDLVSKPYNIRSIFSQELAYNSSLGNGTILLDYSTVESGALYFEANLTNLSPTAQGVMNFTFTSSVSGEFIQGGTSPAGDTSIWLNRGNTYAFDNPYFTDKFSSSAIYSGDQNGTWTISAIIDHSIFEIFLNDGEHAGTMTYYANQPLDTMRFAAAGVAANATVSVGVWALEDTWASQADANGTVLGNVTTSAGNATSYNATTYAMMV